MASRGSGCLPQVNLPQAVLHQVVLHQGLFIWWLGLQRFGSRQVVVLPQVGVICVVSCWLPDLSKVGSDISLAAPNLEVGTFHMFAVHQSPRRYVFGRSGDSAKILVFQ